MNSVLKYLLIILLSLVFSFKVKAQQLDYSTHISQNQVNRLHEQLEYDKTKRALVPRSLSNSNDDRKGRKQNSRNPFLPANNDGFNIIGYTLGGIIVFILLYFIIRSISLSRANERALGIDLEKMVSIEDHDFKTLLIQKLDEMDYRSAIRLHFLSILQLLSKLKLIDWKKNKTNIQYVQECKDPEIKQHFENIASAFDILWYGNENISEEAYQNLAKRSDQLESYLTKKDSL